MHVLVSVFKYTKLLRNLLVYKKTTTSLLWLSHDVKALNNVG